MIEKISLALVNESGEFVLINESDRKIESKIEIEIADYFTKINQELNKCTDTEIRVSEKFVLCTLLRNYLQEIKEHAANS